MGDIFTHAEIIDCPECPPWGKRKDRHHQLMVQSRNYSGSGTDMGVCPECGKSWAISYKVDVMGRVPDWDILPRTERERERKELDKREGEKAEAEDLKEFERLKEKYEPKK